MVNLTRAMLARCCLCRSSGSTTSVEFHGMKVKCQERYVTIGDVLGRMFWIDMLPIFNRCYVFLVAGGI